MIEACRKILSDPRLFADMVSKIYDKAIKETNEGKPITKEQFLLYLRLHGNGFTKNINQYFHDVGKVKLITNPEVVLFKKIIEQTVMRGGLLGSFEAFLSGNYLGFTLGINSTQYIINTYCNLENGESCKAIQLSSSDKVFTQEHQKFMKKFAV